jgi:parallel beta-helix repeat protein
MKVNHDLVLTQITNQTATVGIPLTFTITARDPDNDILAYSAIGLPTGATFDPATRTFAWTPSDSMTGNYSVTFTVSDGVLTDSETRRIMVTLKPKIPPAAQFTANTVQGQAPLTVQFTDQSVSAGTTSYSWDMNNDGVMDYTTKNPAHTYRTAGTYTVKLTVTNADGTDSEIKTNYIQVSSPGVVSSFALYLTDFGIKGDGSDESVKLNAAFIYATANGKKQIIFPAGKTIGINQLIITGTNQELVGNGCTIRLVDNSAVQASYGDFFRILDGCYVHHLKFDGNILGQSHYREYPFGYPWTTNGVRLMSGVLFEYNEVFNVGAYSLTVYQQHNIVIRNNTFHDTPQYGLALKSDGVLCDNVQIIDNTFYNCYQVAIKLAGGKNCLISGNKITIPSPMKGNVDTPEGITLYSLDEHNENMIITNNIIIGNGGNSWGIGSQTSNNPGSKITNNVISRTSTGIYALFNNGIITGNKISGSKQCIVNRGSGNTVNNNICA